MKLHFWQFFLSTKIYFWPFLKWQKMDFGQQNFREIDLFDFTSFFFGWTFFNFLAHCEVHYHTVLKNCLCQQQLELPNFLQIIFFVFLNSSTFGIFNAKYLNLVLLIHLFQENKSQNSVRSQSKIIWSKTFP